MKKKLLFSFLLAVSTATYGQVTNGLVAKYSFNRGNANDESGTNNGTVSGATLTTDRFGNANMAYSFNPNNQAQIIVPNNSAINFTNSTSFTISFWMKINADNLTATVPLGKQVIDGSWNGYSFVLNSTDGGYTNGDGSFFFYTASGAMQDAGANTLVGNHIDEWIFVTGMYLGSTNQSMLIVNDQAQNDVGGVSGTIDNNSNLHFGGYPQNPYSNFFSGSLDDIRFYNRLLTEAEILELYNEVNPVVAASIITLNCGSDQTFSMSSQVTTVPDITTGIATTSCESGGLNVSQSPIAGSNLVTGENIITVTATDNCGTTVSDQMIITFINDLGIEELNTFNSLIFFPNPAKDQLTITVEKPSTIFITNTIGETILNSEIQKTTLIDISNFEAGIYFIKNDSGKTYKFIKN